MVHPYQITCISRSPHFGEDGLLLAACGSKIISVDSQNGSVLSQWPAEVANSTVDIQATLEEAGPPGKKRKLEQSEAPSPSVIKLVVSPDQLYAVAVTGDDKCIRVFEISQEGRLVELSQRCMPKRPCAVLVTPDNQTILCGDKFGDVYSLPLFPKISEETEAKDDVVKTPDVAPVKSYTPTATELTVHTGRNRRALESQLKQKDLQAKSKEPLKFEHQLLLGHVSMLTDVLFVTQTVDGHARSFIITSDRDEHIRISRGPPQAHVVERYCLGHNEFISKLCLLPESNHLVSGGGDDWLGFWDPISGALRGKGDLKAAISGIAKTTKPQSEENDEIKVAVSGLWAVQDSEAGQSVLLAASEKIPALFAVLASDIDSGDAQPTTMELSGIPLDVTISGSTIIISLDAEESPRLLAYKLRVINSQPTLEVDDEYNARLEGVNKLAAPSTPAHGLLYSIENLRKRGADDSQDVA